MNRIDLILELREAYQAAEFGKDVEEQMEIQEPLLKRAESNNIGIHLLSCPDDIFQLFKEKLTQSI